MCGFLLFTLACGAGKNTFLPAGDIIELPSSQVALSPEEQQALADAGIPNVCVPMGQLGDGFKFEITNSLRPGIVAKFIVPESRLGILRDAEFQKRFFTGVKDMIVKAGAAQTQLTAVLLQFEGTQAPSEFKGVAELAASMHPLKLSLGAGVPSFWLSKKLEKSLKGFDFAVLFEQGYAYPPSFNPTLIDTYRGQTKENTPTDVEMPHYVALSLASTGWVARADGAEEVWPGVDMDALVDGAGVTASGQILESCLVDTQYAFEFRRTMAVGRRRASTGDKLTLAVTNYPFRRDTMGSLARRFQPGLLGRYLGPYAPETESGVIGFNTLKDYLGGAIDGPNPRVELAPAGGGWAVLLTNASGLFSDFSASGNYVEWVTAQGRIRDASAGAFQRYRFMKGEEEDVPSRATAVRFYEAFLGPYETVRSGEVYLAGSPSGTFRVHLTLPGGEVLKFKFPVK